MPTPNVDALLAAFKILKRLYDGDANRPDLLRDLGAASLGLVEGAATVRQQGNLAEKIYDVFVYQNRLSRPIRRDLFIHDRRMFASRWDQMIASLNPVARRVESEDIDPPLYTCTLAFACAVDLFKTSSRKTPGTFFEVLVGTLLAHISGRPRGKQIRIPGESYTVPTDIILKARRKDSPTLVIPTKITTRERIVQPWAQQRILDDVFGRGKYKSILVCVSELQRDKDRGVNDICVPQQVGLFQKYLARLEAIYYLDPPARYCALPHVRVKPLSELLRNDLMGLIGPAPAKSQLGSAASTEGDSPNVIEDFSVGDE